MKFSTVEILELDEIDKTNLNEFTKSLEELNDYNEKDIWSAVEKFCEEKEIKKKDFSNLIRMVMTGKRFHVGTQTILFILGLEKVKERVNWIFTFPNIALEKKNVASDSE